MTEVTQERVLLVEDDDSLRQLLVEELEDRGLQVRALASAEEAVGSLESWEPALVVSDLRLPGADGMALLRRVKTMQAAPAFLVITAFGSIQQAVAALKEGADEFLTKPLDLEHFALAVARALETRRLRDEVRRFQQLLSDDRFHGMLGRSRVMRGLFDQIRQLARAEGPVLVIGESGTGKELVARAVHAESERARGPFLAINCAGLPESMAETELFGYGPGAFEGARPEGKLGLLELTAGGTLFLDGVGEMSPRLQAKLLRFLQDGGFRRVGSDEEVYLDVRVICATQVDLSELCAAGQFRQDLYHRLNVLSLHIPPLRDCLDGLQPLALHFIDQASRQIGCPLPTLSPQALERLAGYHWPGNVRQLENTLFQAVSLCEGGTIKPEHIRLPGYGAAQPLGDFSLEGDLANIVGRFEKAVLEGLYKQFPSSRQLGKRLGVSHTTIANKLREHGVGKSEA